MFTPTPQQDAIFSAILAGDNLLVKALAGCGKTSTICEAVRRKAGVEGAQAQVTGSTAVAQGTSYHQYLNNPPSQLLLAFNVKIKEELDARLLGLRNREPIPDWTGTPVPNLTIKTLNGLGHSAWAAGRRLKVNAGKMNMMVEDYCKTHNLTVSYSEKRQIINLLDAARTFGLVPKDSPYPGAGLIPDTAESWAMLWDWIEAEPNKEQQIIANGVFLLSIRRGFEGFIDFIDQLYLPTLYGASWPNVHVLYVDEAQDLSPLNHKMIRLTQAKQKIFVGDPNQAIYGFRGAVSDSMDQLAHTIKGGIIHELPLTVTFRCGREIVRRAQDYVPEYEAAPGNPEGVIEDWSNGYMLGRSDGTDNQNWSLSDIPSNGTVLCRNNAPLLTLALKLLASHRKVTILGRDFAETLKRDIKSASKPGDKVSIVLHKLAEAYAKKLKKTASDSQRAAIDDKVDAIAALCTNMDEGAEQKDIIAVLDRIFEENPSDPGILLSTGHKAKGLEWPWVMHLNPELIPSKWAKTDEALTQEHNIRYVIETRPSHTLVLASLEDLED